MSWLYSRPTEGTVEFLERKFAKRPEIAQANVKAFRAGYVRRDHEGSRCSTRSGPRSSRPARTATSQEPSARDGPRRGERPKRTAALLGAYPITPASGILEELARLKRFGVRTFQAEDEIAAVGAALGASFGGALGVSTSSGPGVVLKAETVGLAVALELPLVILDIQRAGPSTGMPTKPEQADLLMVMFVQQSRRCVVAATSPGHCFEMAIEAARIALKYRRLSSSLGRLSGERLGARARSRRCRPSGHLAASPPSRTTASFLPYVRDPETLAREWARRTPPEHRIGASRRRSAPATSPTTPTTTTSWSASALRRSQESPRTSPSWTVDHQEGANLLVLGWGGTHGPIAAGVRSARERGVRVSQAHLAYLNPFPRNLGDVLRSYDRVLVPEMNLGQLLKLVRGVPRRRGRLSTRARCPVHFGGAHDAIEELARRNSRFSVPRI